MDDATLHVVFPILMQNEDAIFPREKARIVQQDVQQEGTYVAPTSCRA